MNKKACWKEILFIGIGFVIALTVISIVVVGEAILNQRNIELGQKFKKRKEAFQQQLGNSEACFNKKWKNEDPSNVEVSQEFDKPNSKQQGSEATKRIAR